MHYGVCGDTYAHIQYVRTHMSYIRLYCTNHYTYTVYIKQYHLVSSYKVRATYSVVTLQGVNITISDRGGVYSCTLNKQTVNITSVRPAAQQDTCCKYKLQNQLPMCE